MLESTNKCLYLIIYKIINKKINDDGQAKENIRLTLLDILDTTVSKLDSAGHIIGPQCRCTECNQLKRTEDKWILRLGTFHGASGPNCRDEIVGTVR